MRRIIIRVSLVLLILVACGIYLVARGVSQDPAAKKPGFTVTKETTFVTEPLDDNGYVDYVAALNEHLRQGVTPKNNAHVPLWQAFGPRPEGGNRLSDEFFKWMGIDPPPEQGDYLIKLHTYVKEHLQLDEEALKRIDDEFAEARKRPWKAADYREVVDFLKANDKPLALVVEASKRPKYYFPLVPGDTDKGRDTMIGCRLPTAQSCRVAANALLARAMLRLGEGQDDQAWQDLIACHRLARHVGQGGTLIEGLVGYAIDGLASVADVAFLQHAKLDSRLVQECLRQLQGLAPMRSTADRINWAERFMLLDIITMMDRRGISALRGIAEGVGDEPDWLASIVYFNIAWDKALQNANRWYDRIVAALEKKDVSERSQLLADIENDIKTLKSETMDLTKTEILRLVVSGQAKGEAVGNILISLLLPALMKVQTAADRWEQSQSSLQVAFALAAYHSDHQKYPAKLEELAPKYLARVPQDIFSGKPLVYRPTPDGYLLYSVGPNGKDDNGRSYEDHKTDYDMPIRMPPVVGQDKAKTGG